MAVRPFLYLGDAVCKCVFSSVRLKPRLHTTELYKNFRRYGRFQKISKTSVPHGYVEKGPVNFGKMWKPFMFTIMFSGTTFTAAVIWEYERIRDRTLKMFNVYEHFGIRRSGWRHEMKKWWNSLTEGEKIFVPICFLNVLVFLAWRVPSLQKTMLRYFSAHPASNAVCWPMLLSTFSHYSFLHLAANMYVLHSFCSLAVASLGKEQFVALYLSGGVISSLVSNLYKAAFGFQISSLGASGAVMAILGYVSAQFPDIYLSIIFLPMYKFTAGMAIKAVMGLDILGCLLRWQYFDHAAHLGGVLFGIFWQAWGNAHIWQKRDRVLELWHEIRGPPKST